MLDIMKCAFLFSLLTADVLSDRARDYSEPQQGGRTLFFLGGLFRKIKSRWQNQNLPPSPYGGGPIFTGYYGCFSYNCRPPQYQVVQPVAAIQPVPAVQPITAVVQTPVVVQQSQVFQPNTFAQAVAPPNPNPNPMYPVQPQPQPPPQPLPYPAQASYGSPQPAYGSPQPAYGSPQPPYGSPQPAYGSPQPAYGTPQPTYGSPQPYQPYPAYPSAYASSVPGQMYQNAACAYTGYPCGRKI